MLGAWSFLAVPAAVEILGLAGCDFVFIDCEHAPVGATGPQIEDLVRAADVVGTSPVVRLPRNPGAAVGKVLDAGAEGVLLPQVESAAEVRDAVAAATLPPLGHRGAAPMTRAAKYGLADWDSWVEGARRPALVGALIETVAGVEAVDEVAAVPGVGFIFFGALDFALSAGAAPGVATAQMLADARARVYRAAARHGVPVGDGATDAESAAALVARGARLLTVGTDVSLLAGAGRDCLVSTRAAVRGMTGRSAGGAGW